MYININLYITKHLFSFVFLLFEVTHVARLSTEPLHVIFVSTAVSGRRPLCTIQPFPIGSIGTNSIEFLGCRCSWCCAWFIRKADVIRTHVIFVSTAVSS